MKTYNIDEKLKDGSLIRRSIEKVCKSKKRKPKGENRKYLKAQHILKYLDHYTELTREIIEATEKAYQLRKNNMPIPGEIKLKVFIPQRCKPRQIIDGPTRKTREIVSVPIYPDQVIHQILIEACAPTMTKSFYDRSYGSIPGRGAHKGQNEIKRIIKYHKTNDKSAIKYVAKLDVTKCYQSIPHWYIEKCLRAKFRGTLFISLMMSIVDSYHSRMDDGKKVGISIGYSTSQWLCNFVFTKTDYFIKQNLKVKHYVRYIDDMVLFGRNKKELHRAVRAIIKYLGDIGIRIKGNWQVYRFDYIDKSGKRRGRDIDFLGLRFFRDKTILRKRLALAIRRQALHISKAKVVSVKDARSFMSRSGWMRHCNSKHFYLKNVKPYVNIKKLKKIISDESKIRAAEGVVT